MPLVIGQVLKDRYRIVRRLGQGGFGTVYRAWDINLSRPCAIKENLDVSPAIQRQFTREASLLANLSHPNLPRVFDHFTIPGAAPDTPAGQYLVMDFIEGEDLNSVVEQGGAVPESKALVWIGQVLDALEYMHSQHPPILHRDIKPSNIRINTEGQAILVDFGLVKRLEGPAHTTTGAQAVSPGYSPPEQYGQGSTDPRSDIYSLGATLYAMLTAQPPQESVARVARDELRPAHLADPKVSVWVSQVAVRAMALAADHRYQNASEFKAALAHGNTIYLSSQGRLPEVQSSVAYNQAASARSILPPQARWPIVLVSAASVIMALIVLGILWVRSNGGWQAVFPISSSPTRTVQPTDRVQGDSPAQTDAPIISTEPVTPILSSPSAPDLPTTVPTLTPVSILGGVPGIDLAFASDLDGSFGVYIMDTTNNTAFSLPRPAGYELAWWPWFCGSRLAAEVVDLDGGNPQWIGLINPLTRMTELWLPPIQFDELGVPRCSHRGQYLTYSGRLGNEWDMYFAYLDGSETYTLDGDNIIAGYSSWNWRDDTIFYLSVVTRDSYEIRSLAGLPGVNFHQTIVEGKYPAVSPDGSLLAFMCNPGSGRLDLCLFNLGGRFSTALAEVHYREVDYDHDGSTNNNSIPASPAWSGDGQWIYFTSFEENDWDIYRIHPDGSGLQNVTADWNNSNEIMPATQW